MATGHGSMRPGEVKAELHALEISPSCSQGTAPLMPDSHKHKGLHGAHEKTVASKKSSAGAHLHGESQTFKKSKGGTPGKEV